jgi:hypothetical protein
MVCDNCGQVGHRARLCKNPARRNDADVVMGDQAGSPPQVSVESGGALAAAAAVGTAGPAQAPAACPSIVSPNEAPASAAPVSGAPSSREAVPPAQQRSAPTGAGKSASLDDVANLVYELGTMCTKKFASQEQRLTELQHQNASLQQQVVEVLKQLVEVQKQLHEERSSKAEMAQALAALREEVASMKQQQQQQQQQVGIQQDAVLAALTACRDEVVANRKAAESEGSAVRMQMEEVRACQNRFAALAADVTVGDTEGAEAPPAAGDGGPAAGGGPWKQVLMKRSAKMGQQPQAAAVSAAHAQHAKADKARREEEVCARTIKVHGRGVLPGRSTTEQVQYASKLLQKVDLQKAGLSEKAIKNIRVVPLHDQRRGGVAPGDGAAAAADGGGGAGASQPAAGRGAHPAAASQRFLVFVELEHPWQARVAVEGMAQLRRERPDARDTNISPMLTEAHARRRKALMTTFKEAIDAAVRNKQRYFFSRDFTQLIVDGKVVGSLAEGGKA